MVSFSPTIDFVIPTLNSGVILESCLQSIRSQNYSQSKINILIVDGGSTDNTLSIANKFSCQILKNPLKTAEAGKAVGLKHLKSDFVALIDSDNILPTSNWLTNMLIPLQDSSIIGSEPIKYTYRPHGGFIERYSALTGVNDPYMIVAGNFDRYSLIYNRWTNLSIPTKIFKKFLFLELNTSQLIPTIGANGTIFRSDIFSNFSSDYFIDIDFLTTLPSPIKFAKVKVGIIHTFCESSISKFIKKQTRRATDLYIYRHLRTNFLVHNNTIPTIKFTLYVCLLIPMLWHTAIGYFRKPDPAWFFHPLACIITLWVYSRVTILHLFNNLHPINRQVWKQ